MSVAKVLSLGSGFRSYAAGAAIASIGVLGMATPTYHVVFGDYGLTVEMWNLIQQAAVALGGLAVIFLRSAIAKISPMLADSLMPFIQTAIDKAIAAAMEKIKPKPDGGDLIFSDPVKLED